MDWILHIVYFIKKGVPGRRTERCWGLCSACCRNCWKEGDSFPMEQLEKSWAEEEWKRPWRGLQHKCRRRMDCARNRPHSKGLDKEEESVVSSAEFVHHWRLLVGKNEEGENHLIKEDYFHTLFFSLRMKHWLVLTWYLCIQTSGIPLLS